MFICQAKQKHLGSKNSQSKFIKINNYHSDFRISPNHNLSVPIEEKSGYIHTNQKS